MKFNYAAFAILFIALPIQADNESDLFRKGQETVSETTGKKEEPNPLVLEGDSKEAPKTKKEAPKKDPLLETPTPSSEIKTFEAEKPTEFSAEDVKTVLVALGDLKECKDAAERLFYTALGVVAKAAVGHEKSAEILDISYNAIKTWVSNPESRTTMNAMQTAMQIISRFPAEEQTQILKNVMALLKAKPALEALKTEGEKVWTKVKSFFVSDSQKPEDAS